MHRPALALLVRFQSALSSQEVMRRARERLPDFQALPGLQQKYYLHDEGADEYAGLYLWSSSEDLEDYQASELRATIAETYEVVGSPRIEVYSVFDLLRDEG